MPFFALSHWEFFNLGITIMIKRIEDIFTDIESVRGSSDKVTTGLKYNYYSYLNIVDVKKRQLERNLDELKRARASSYDEVKKGIENSVAELKMLLSKIRHLFKK